jgi:hypothetical protein
VYLSSWLTLAEGVLPQFRFDEALNVSPKWSLRSILTIRLDEGRDEI